MQVETARRVSRLHENFVFFSIYLIMNCGTVCTTNFVGPFFFFLLEWSSNISALFFGIGLSKTILLSVRFGKMAVDNGKIICSQ